MENQVFSKEQMRELESLGINIRSNVSMAWFPKMMWDKETNKTWVDSYYLDKLKVPSEHFWNTREGKETIPTFTFFDGVNVLPKFLNIGDETYFLSLLYDRSNGVVVTYATEHINKILHSTGSSNQVTAVFEMIKWCKKNKHL